MAMLTYVPARPSSRYFEPRERFGSSLASSWFYASRSIADSELRDEPEELSVLCHSQGRQRLRRPSRPHLHRMFEAQLARLDTGAVRRLCHEQSDQVVGEQIHPQFLLHHRRALATESLHAQGRLDAAQVQLYVPALLVELGQLALGCRAWFEQRAHQDASADLQLAHRQLWGERRILLAAHPRRPRLGLGPAHPMITLAQPLAATKVGNARAMLLEQYVHTGRLEHRDQKVIAVESVGQQQIASRQRWQKAAKQGQLAASFARMRSDGRLQYDACREANDPHQSRQGKADPFGLSTGLWIARLIARGIGHRDAGAVGQLHASAAPAPRLLRSFIEQTTTLARQSRDHLQWHSPSGSAVRPCAHALHAQALGHALCGPAINGSLAGAILLERLFHKHRQCHRRWVEALAVLGQMALGHLQQLRPRQQVEEIDRARLANLPTHAISMLLGMKSDITIGQGCGLRGWWGGCVVTTSYQSRSAFPLLLQSFSSMHLYRWGLSQCHYP